MKKDVLPLHLKLIMYCDATFEPGVKSVIGCISHKGRYPLHKFMFVKDINVAEYEAILMTVKHCESICKTEGIQYACIINSDSQNAIDLFSSNQVETTLCNLIVRKSNRDSWANTYARHIKEKKRE